MLLLILVLVNQVAGQTAAMLAEKRKTFVLPTDFLMSCRHGRS